MVLVPSCSQPPSLQLLAFSLSGSQLDLLRQHTTPTHCNSAKLRVVRQHALQNALSCERPILFRFPTATGKQPMTLEAASNKMALFSRTARVLHVARRAVCILVALVMLYLLFSLLWSPPLEKARGGTWRPGTAWGKPSQQPRSILDNLDATLEKEDCISLLRDSRRIRSSVQVELQLLEDQRRELAEQVMHLSRTHTRTHSTVYRACVVHRYMKSLHCMLHALLV